jgi:hypothetical protein
MSGDDDEIARFIAQRGVTKCPTRAAAVLGETSPGWRRRLGQQERKEAAGFSADGAPAAQAGPLTQEVASPLADAAAPTKCTRRPRAKRGGPWKFTDRRTKERPHDE